ncbi:MAG: hypothetical protein P1V18_03625 [Candidatus Gracilibacteria bacterium]|nr:hypothetical protein [Candidatus Gracilibacteria bacterium]
MIPSYIQQQDICDHAQILQSGELFVIVMDDEERIRKSIKKMIDGVIIQKGTPLSIEGIHLPISSNKKQKDFRKKTSFKHGVTIPKDIELTAKTFSHPDDAIKYLKTAYNTRGNKALSIMSDINYREHHSDKENRKKTQRTLTQHIAEIKKATNDAPIPVNAYSTCDGAFFDKIYGAEKHYAGRSVKPHDQIHANDFTPQKTLLIQNLSLWILWSVNYQLSLLPPKKSENRQETHRIDQNINTRLSSFQNYRERKKA